MASIHGFSLPDGFEAGASFMLSKEPWGDHSQDIDSVHVAVKSGKARLHVALPKISGSASADDIVKLSLPLAQKYLDLVAVQTQLAYRILHQYDNVIWRRTVNLPKLQISATLPITTGMSASPQLIDAEGNVVGSQAQSPKAQAAFRYYRFASSSGDLFEAYRYIFLCLESALDDLRPRVHPEGEKEWLGDALRQAVHNYSLDLSAFSTAARDAVDHFIRNHYVSIRCATFHAKASAGSLMPGNLADVEQVDEQLRKLQPIVKHLLKEHFFKRDVTFRSSGMTPHFLNLQLEKLIPAMWLATSPRHAPDLTQEVRSALTSSGYYDTLPKRPEEVTESTIEKLDQSIRKAQQQFPFDLLHVTLDGTRLGYDDEWIVTAKT